jgi:hypothetical protein
MAQRGVLLSPHGCGWKFLLVQGLTYGPEGMIYDCLIDKKKKN